VKKKTDQYHHGELRSALITQAVKMIEENGVEGLTIRALSKTIGVSHTAPYRHFADKTELLCAIAEEGFIKLQTHLKLTALDSSVDAIARFEKMALNCIEFAVKNPGYYRLMFGKETVAQSPSPKLRAAAKDAFSEVNVIIEACQDSGLFKEHDSLSLANIVWATVHGLSTLIIDNQIYTEDIGEGSLESQPGTEIPNKRNLDNLVKFAIQTLIDGMRVDGVKV
jgi:AcrR family transcriptional regulator